MKPLTHYCRRRKVNFWGQDYFVTPRLVDWIHGDGLKVLNFVPLATRPARYLVRIDSKMETDSEAFYDLLDSIYEAIEDEFGQASWQDDNGKWRHDPFPALDDSCGSAWSVIDVLKKPDKRQERRVRADLKRAA